MTQVPPGPLLDVSVYTEPGVYQQEDIVPQALAASPAVQLLCIIGIAPRTKPSNNESVRRGQVNLEAVTLGSTPGSHTYTLAHNGNRRQQDTQLFAAGNLLPNAAYSYLLASVKGPNGTFNIAAGTFVTFALDGRPFISIELTAGATQAASAVASDINTALAANPSYGVAYNAAASAVGAAVQLASPASTLPSVSDLRFLPTPASTPSFSVDGTTAIFGVGAPYVAPVEILVADLYYNALSTYTISYIALDTTEDLLSQTPVIAVQRVGSYANVTSFQPATDYTLDTNSIDWSPPDVQAKVTSAVGPFDLTSGVNNVLFLAINGLAAIAVTLPVGATVAVSALVTAINQALIANAAYGPLYGAVASAVGGALVLTAPNPFLSIPLGQGVNSSIEFFATPANAVTLLFGIQTASLPFLQTGTGNRPAPGASYFVTYTYTRPSSDYNNASSTNNLFTTLDTVTSYTGGISSNNVGISALTIAAGIAFQNQCPQLLLIQVNDTTTPGFPSINEVKAAIDAAASNESVTDIVVLDTRLAVQTYLLLHCTTQSSLTEKNYRKGWYGVSQNTPIGDIDTPNSLVSLAQVTLQVPPDSPGRGRSIVTAPPNVSTSLTFTDGTSSLVPLDSTYLAVATAAVMTSFTSIATSLLRKTVTGFDINSFQIYQKQERATLASNGVNVVTLRGGNLVLTDPVTTEQGAGNLAEFREINAMNQKDTVVRAVDQALDTNIIGLVPSDIADFDNDIKSFIAQALQGQVTAGNCARYKDAAGNVRDINLQTDIQVFQDPSDPTSFQYRYFFNLRYTAKRIFGLYSVDNPFFSGNANTVQTS